MSNDNGVRLTIGGGDEAEFFERFDRIARRLGYAFTSAVESQAKNDVPPSVTAGFPPSDAIGEETARAALDTPVKRRPGRPRGYAFRSKPFPTIARPESVERPEVAKSVTLENAKDAGRVVLHKGGVDALRDLLTEFQVGKIGDLKEEAWARFIDRCHTVTTPVVAADETLPSGIALYDGLIRS